MSDPGWFKHWARESILSDDLAALSDHEERVWWRLLAVASTEEPRWTATITQRLAEKCKSTPAKLAKALTHMQELDMVAIEGDTILLLNALRWNEDSRNKPPSADRDAVRERVTRWRNARRNEGVTTIGNDPVTRGVTSGRNDHKESEQEEEKEQEEDLAAGPNKPITAAFLAEEQRLHPRVNVQHVYEKAKNRDSWDGYKDKRRALRDRIKWAEEKLAPVKAPVEEITFFQMPKRPTA